MPLQSPFLTALAERDDLSQYGSNAVLLFALQIRCNIEDIHSVAVQCLTDGADDKKCDLVFVDRDRGVAVVAQGYFSPVGRQAAPSGKAADLNTAIAWLLSTNLDSLPARLRPAAAELRDALADEKIETFELWYVHNCPASENVRGELETVERATKAALSAHYHGQSFKVRGIEAGTAVLDEWYGLIQAPITVRDEFVISVPGGYVQKSSDWESFSTAVPARWLHEIYKVHRTRLFSANVRDYLGSRRSDSNINHGIKTSVSSRSEDFWVFNNGITALVNDLEFTKGGTKVKLNGISIVNGAQTTGAIGSLDTLPSKEAMVPARFIKCRKPDLVREIVLYNNTQNKINPADFRSTDAVQDRLRTEFTHYPTQVSYLGARRGGGEDAIRRQNHLPSDTVAQALAAFHKRPDLAYNRKSEIWTNDELYTSLFHEGTHAGHIVFSYSLHRAVSSTKRELMDLSNSGQPMRQTDKDNLEFLRYRGSIFLVMSAIGAAMEIYLDSVIPNAFALRFEPELELDDAEAAWRAIVATALPFRNSLRVPLMKGLKNSSEVEQALMQFKTMVEATQEVNRPVYQEFARRVTSARLGAAR